MTKLDILNKWKSIGWNNAKQYHQTIIFETPQIKEFDPNQISPQQFWQAADEHFYTDAVANSDVHRALLNVDQSNLNNHNIALYLGMIGQLEMAVAETKRKFNKPRIAEIGCGYGSLYENYIKPNCLNYTGFDVIKRFPQAFKIKGEDGTFSANQIKKYKEEFNIFYSANVFQHLSPKQITQYLNQIYDLLPYGGYANIMYVYDVNNTYHYGQTVEIIPRLEFEQLINQIGYNIISSTTSNRGLLKPFSVLLEK